jgi:nucleoside 2-deoxyribosyltransferase
MNAERKPDGPRIYLAGPDVFRPKAMELAAEDIAILAKNGLVGIFPCDCENDEPKNHSAAEEGTNPLREAERIFNGNVALIAACDAVLADASPFRGSAIDPGTAFEIGLAVAMGKPVIVRTMESRDLADRIEGKSFADGVIVDRNGAFVENFGLSENLMIDIAARRSGHPPIRRTEGETRAELAERAAVAIEKILRERATEQAGGKTQP